jgi:phosphate:Na+ symporter
MGDDLLTLLGGIGLFLFGMQTMTAALRDLSSHRVRGLLARFTATPLSGSLTGMATTAMIQSSSATIIIAIGFVGAGLLSFSQALGIVFGANVGTTVTGWMVMLLGLKLELGRGALVLLFAASLLRLIFRGRVARLALALTGFSLVFLGLDLMQSGAAGFQGIVTPAAFPADSLAGRLQLLLVGVAVVVVIQSSSAGVAMALVLLQAGSISFAQAAAVVIGMDIGTTATGVIAAMGGSSAMRRTAAAHVACNLVTGLIAFAALGAVAPVLLDRIAGGDGPVALVLFHTLFNVVGVAVILPFTRPFAALLGRLIPERGGKLPELPDSRLLSDAGAAIDAARGCAQGIATTLFAALGRRLRDAGKADELAALLPAASVALEELESYLAQLPLPEGSADPLNRYSALLHQLDHLQRLTQRAGQSARIAALAADPRLRRPALVLALALDRAATAPSDAATAARLLRSRALIGGRTARLRRAALLRNRAASGGPTALFDLTDALRWLDRSAEHAARIVHYGTVAAKEAPARAEAAREPTPLVWPP